LTITNVVFTLAPRINAAGRIESGLRAVELLITTSMAEAEQCCDGVNNNNTERTELDKGITEEALEYISSDPEMLKRRSTVLFNSNWHKGVIGIVASRVIESYYKPTIVLTESNGKATGSARSVVGFDVYNAIDACSEHLEQFGGHMYAAGLTMKLEKLDDFIAAFEKYVSANITEEQLTPVIDIDAKLELDQINDKFYSVLKQFAPFGPMNMRPVFQSDNVVLAAPVRIVGENHLKVVLKSKSGDLKIDAIGFKMAHYAEAITRSSFSISYVIDENEWRGKKSLQLMLKDIKVS
jgi:single-stranded-DNA-specific exonuclease